MTGARPRRVAEQLQRFLSERLISERHDPRFGFATVTGVEISPDLREARVFVTVLDPDPARRREALAALNHASGHFRRDIGRTLRLRYTPSLRFEEDTTIESADRIERLIRRIREEEPPGQGSDESE